MSSSPHDKGAAISRNRPNSPGHAAKAAADESGIEQVGEAVKDRSAVEQTSRHEGTEVNQAPASGSGTSTHHAGLRDEERSTGNDRALAANNAPQRSSAEQPGKPTLGGIRQD